MDGRTAMQAALEALERCLPIIQREAQMMADISRFAPLPHEAQAQHDSTEYESEKLLRDVPAALSLLRAALEAREPVKHWCETCEGLGTIDETLGGESFSNPKATCPDCDGQGWWTQ